MRLNKQATSPKSSPDEMKPESPEDPRDRHNATAKTTDTKKTDNATIGTAT
jgi:hypothetical protein